MKRSAVLLLILALLWPAAVAEGMVGMADPWRETTAEGLMQTLGVAFGVPEGAKDIVYRMLEPENLAEMRFAWQGAEYVARIKPAAEFEDISGFCYSRYVEEVCAIGWCEGQILSTDGATVCLWYDAAPGLMYSVSTAAPMDVQVDILALAEVIYLPAQGEVE